MSEKRNARFTLLFSFPLHSSVSARNVKILLFLRAPPPPLFIALRWAVELRNWMKSREKESKPTLSQILLPFPPALPFPLTLLPPAPTDQTKERKIDKERQGSSAFRPIFPPLPSPHFFFPSSPSFTPMHLRDGKNEGEGEEEGVLSSPLPFFPSCSFPLFPFLSSVL